MTKTNFFKELRRYLKFQGENRTVRANLRKTGIYVYRSKAKAKRIAKKRTVKNKVVYWVMDEMIGYYVINLYDIDRLNKNENKHKGFKKIRIKDLNNTCVWRSPLYASLNHFK